MDKLCKAEMISDEFEIKPEPEIAEGIFSVASKTIVDEDSDDQNAKVNNVVKAFYYEKFEMKKDLFKTYFKKHLKAVITKMTEDKASEENIAIFKKSATPFFKFLIKNFKDMDIYVTSETDTSVYASLVYGIWLG